MLKDDLLPLLQREADRLGLRPFTDRAWHDWLEAKLIVSPTPRGRERGLNPEWVYPHETLERALILIRLMAAGTKRRSLLRIYLWLHDYKVPEALLIEDLSSEFKRLLARQFFRRPWIYDAGAIDAARNRGLQEQRLEPVDPGIAVAAPMDETILELGSMLCWDTKNVRAFDLVIEEIARMSGGSADQIASHLSPLERYLDVIRGLFGNPDEIEQSGLAQISRVNSDDLLAARNLYKFATRLFDLLALIPESMVPWNLSDKTFDAEKVARSLRTPDWTVAIGSIGALLSLRQRGGGS